MRCARVIGVCLEDGYEAFIPATSLKDVFYFAEKSAGPDAGYRAIRLILDIATPAQVDGVVCRDALQLERPDYEDGIVAACMRAENVAAVVTRDASSFNDPGVPKYSPRDFIVVCGYGPVSW